jgi:AcrR family transcriptional regulator
VGGQRLSREKRRAQLLDTALAIVCAEGAEALTLARVAEEAGVTKPIAYEHFETRAGLLKALYRRIDEQQCEAARSVLDARASTLEEAVSILSEAYVDCVLHIGKEFGTITAALSTIAETDEFLHAGRERYAEIYLEGLKRFNIPPSSQRKTIMLGVIGAAEALAREVTADRLGRRQAIDAISRIMLGAVSGAPRRAKRE